MAFTNLKLYEKLNDFLKENNYSLCLYSYEYNRKAGIYKVTYKNDADALERCYTKEPSIEFHSNKVSKDGYVSKLILYPHSNFFRLKIFDMEIDFHKADEFFIWFKTYRKEFERYYTTYAKYQGLLREIEKQQYQIYNKQDECTSKFRPLVKKFKEEQEHRWKFDKENYKMKKILSKLD